MAKISQSAAQTAAYKIAEPINVKAQQVMSQIQEFVVGIHLKDVPAEIKKLYETHPSWIRTTSDCYVTGPGISGSYYVNFKKNQPAIKSYRVYIALSAKEAEKVVKLKDQHDDLLKKYNETKQEIEKTILTLGTHKRIGEVMPNALRFLPEAKTGTTTQLVLQIQPIVDKVNCLITNEDKCVDKL